MRIWHPPSIQNLSGVSSSILQNAGLDPVVRVLSFPYASASCAPYHSNIPENAPENSTSHKPETDCVGHADGNRLRHLPVNVSVITSSSALRINTYPLRPSTKPDLLSRLTPHARGSSIYLSIFTRDNDGSLSRHPILSQPHTAVAATTTSSASVAVEMAGTSPIKVTVLVPAMLPSRNMGASDVSEVKTVESVTGAVTVMKVVMFAGMVGVAMPFMG